MKYNMSDHLMHKQVIHSLYMFTQKYFARIFTVMITADYLL